MTPLLFASLAACAGLGQRLEAPKVEVVGVRLVFLVIGVCINLRPRRVPFEQDPEELDQPFAVIVCPCCDVECSSVAIL